MILHELQITGGSYVEIRARNLRPDADRQRAGIISRWDDYALLRLDSGGNNSGSDTDLMSEFSFRYLWY